MDLRIFWDFSWIGNLENPPFPPLQKQYLSEFENDRLRSYIFGAYEYDTTALCIERKGRIGQREKQD